MNIARSSVAILCYSLMVGCGRRTAWNMLPSTYLLSLDADRPLADTSRVGRVGDGVKISLPPGLQGFSLMWPVSVSAVDYPLCELVVADYGDRAIHVFDLQGVYKRSIALPFDDSAAFKSIVSVTLSPSGTVAVSDMGHRDIKVFDSRGRLHRRISPRIPRGDEVPTGSVLLGAAGTLVEHWFSMDVPMSSSSWTADSLPLMWLVDSTGTAVGRVGTVEAYPGVGFTAALNRGLMASDGDTLWFARRADGRVLAFPLPFSTRKPVRQIELPVFFRIQQPRELARPGHRLEVVLEEHVRAFAIAPSGEFLLGQSVSYPSSSDSLFRPRTVLTILDRDGSQPRYFDLRMEIFGLTAAGDRLFAIGFDAEDHSRVVRSYPLPARRSSGDDDRERTRIGRCRD